MITTTLVSIHLRFPMNNCKIELTSWGKIKRNRYSNLVSFFQRPISLLAYVATFSGQLHIGRSYFFTLFGVASSTQQLPFRGSYFFRTAAGFLLFQNSQFFAVVIFQNSIFFRAKFPRSSHFLRITSSLRRLLFGTAIFFGGTI